MASITDRATRHKQIELALSYNNEFFRAVGLEAMRQEAIARYELPRDLKRLVRDYPLSVVLRLMADGLAHFL